MSGRDERPVAGGGSAPGSGGAAGGGAQDADAALTGTRPAWLDAPLIDPNPFPSGYDLREPPALHPACNRLVPYIGLWRGRGGGGYPTVDDFEFGQEVRISHDGRPFLFYESRTWLLDGDGQPVKLSYGEVGWWRPVVSDGRPTDELEVILSSHTGIVELYIGRIDGTRIEMVTDAVMRTATAKEVSAGQRMFGIVDGALLYAQEMAAVGVPMTAHTSARLIRVGG